MLVKTEIKRLRAENILDLLNSKRLLLLYVYSEKTILFDSK